MKLDVICTYYFDVKDVHFFYAPTARHRGALSFTYVRPYVLHLGFRSITEVHHKQII